MISKNDKKYTQQELQEFYDKLSSLCPQEHPSDYLQGCHFVLMHLKRFITGKNPFKFELPGLSVKLKNSESNE